MRYRTWVAIALTALSAGCAQPDDGTAASQEFGTLSLFDPVKSDPALTSPIIPFPFNGLFAGFNDPTLNIPNPTSISFVGAANEADGFSTTASIFTDLLGFVDYGTAARGIVIINSATGQRLVAGVDYTVQPSPAIDATAPNVPINTKRSRLLIEPLKPLAPSTTYLVALTTAIKSTDGIPATASDQFKLVRSGTPVSQQTEPILQVLSAAQKQQLEVLRSSLIRPAVVAILQITGLKEGDLVLAWPFTTESVSKTLNAINTASAARTLTVAATGLTTRDINVLLADTADIYAGIFSLPYYLTNTSGGAAPTDPLTKFWLADASKPDTGATFLGQVPCGAFATGATLPDGQTARPSLSTTICYPEPAKQSDETVPVLVTVPNNQGKPAGGWPVVIFQHGITRNRTDMFALAPTLATAGFVVVAIDMPLHGLADNTNPFYRNQLFNGTPAAGLITGERTFDLDLQNNVSGAPVSDDTIDPSGAWFINLTSLLTSRDNLRQSVSDLLYLTKSVGSLDLNSDGTADIDASRIFFVGHSLGGIVGGTLLGVNSDIKAATLAMPGSGVAKLLDASKTFGPRIAAGLAASGVNEGTDTYETFLRFAQQLVDPGDPVNFAATARANHAIHMIEVVGDTVVPNTALATIATTTSDTVTIGGFLSGTEPLFQQMGLEVQGLSVLSGAGVTVRTSTSLGVVVRFAEGNHGSILDPSGGATNAAVTCEMQRETATFLASQGTVLPVGGPCP